jgi:hypothetical protein
MTRKRTRENLVQQLCEPCSYCDGRGYVISAESVAYKVLREIRKDLPRFCGRQIAVSVNPRVAEMLLGPARRATHRLSGELGREIEIRARPGLHQEQFEVTALDQGPPVEIPLGWLGDRSRERRESAPERPALPETASTEPTSPEVSEAPISRRTDGDGADPEAQGNGVPDLDLEAQPAPEVPGDAVDASGENRIIPRLQIGEDS